MHVRDRAPGRLLHLASAGRQPLQYPTCRSSASERVGTALLARGAPTAAALLEGDEVVTLRGAGRAGRASARRAGAVRRDRSSCSRHRTRSSSSRPTWRSSPATTCHCSLASTPSSWQRRGPPMRWCDVDGDELHVVRLPGRAERELHPDLALLLSTSGSTGSPKLVRLSHDQRAEQRRVDRHLPRTHGCRPSDHDTAPALLLRALGAALAPARRGKHRDADGVSRRPVLRRGHAAPRGDERRRRAAHLRAPRTRRTRARARPIPALHDPGRGSTATRSGPGVAGPHAGVGRRPLHHVRADGGDGAHGIPPAGVGLPAPTGNRAADPGRRARGAPARRDARRRRGARVPRPQRHARLRDRRRRISPRAPSSTSWRPATSPASTPTTASSRSSGGGRAS